MGKGSGGGGTTTQNVVQQLSPQQQQYLNFRNQLIQSYLQPFANYMYGGPRSTPPGGYGFGNMPSPPPSQLGTVGGPGAQAPPPTNPANFSPGVVNPDGTVNNVQNQGGG